MARASNPSPPGLAAYFSWYKQLTTSMFSSPTESGCVGLSLSCRHMRPVHTDRGSVYYLCQRAATEQRSPKCPDLPVLQFHSYKWEGQVLLYQPVESDFQKNLS